MQEVRKFFTQRFGHPPIRLVRAPGRLELLGNHTDYNEGLVMAIAVDRSIQMASAPRFDGKIVLNSSAFSGTETFDVHDFTKNPAAPWANYVKGVLDQLERRHVHFSGFSAAVHSTIPMGAGLSSSAALEVATALTVRQLFPYTLTLAGLGPAPLRDAAGVLPPPAAPEKLQLARLCQAAENQFVGVNCGPLDMITSLFGRAFQVVEIDCQSLTIQTLPLIGEIAIVVCDSGVKHALVAGEYNARRHACESASRKLGAKSLRSVEPRWLQQQRKSLTESEYGAAYHVVGEIQRVVHGAHALRNDDFEQFGQFMFQSHESSRDFFQNSAPELDLLVELARVHPGCLGARLTGGGFGGATINLIRRDQTDSFVRSMATLYEKRTGHALKPMVCQVVDGAG